MFRIKVVRSDAPRRGDEHEGLGLEHPASLCFDLWLDFGQQIGQQRGIFGYVFDVFERSPAAGLLNPPDGFANWNAGGVGLSINAQRQVGLVIFDRAFR